MAEQPRNKAEQAVENKAETVYVLESPDGRPYRTVSLPEARNMNRTAGYKLVSPKEFPA